MKGLKLILDEGGARFDESVAVEGFAAAVQNAMVGIATAKGSDRIYPKKGTGLFTAAVSGALVDPVAAAHHSNFAAVDTLFFSRTTDYADSPHKLAKIKLTPVVFDGRQMDLSAEFTSLNGDVLGVDGKIQ